MKLENSKFGKFIKKENYKVQGDLSVISKGMVLNVYFDPINLGYYSEFERKYEIKLLPELMEIYSKYNGFSLCSYSFNIFGIDLHSDDVYQTTDLVDQNIFYNLPNKNKKFKNFVIFGSVASDYLFAYDSNEQKEIFIISAETFNVERTFPSFKSFMDFSLNYLNEEYDEQCLKKGVSNKVKKYGYMNISFDMFL